MTNLKEFESYANNFTKSNQYDFRISYPSISELLQTGDLEKKTRLFARNISVPSTDLSIQVERVLTERRITQVNIEQDNVIITFFDTKTAFFHNFFNIWINSKFNDKGGIVYYPDNFSGSAEIYLNDNLIYEVEGMSPLTVSEFRLDDSSVNEFGTFTVSFYVKKLVSKTRTF